MIGQLATRTESVGLPRSHRQHSAAVAAAAGTAAAAGCDVAGLAATGTAGLDMHYTLNISRNACLVVEGMLYSLYCKSVVHNLHFSVHIISNLKLHVV